MKGFLAERKERRDLKERSESWKSTKLK